MVDVLTGRLLLSSGAQMSGDLENRMTESSARAAINGRTFSAPGRVNLIGEHTDYTGGFVLPMAIDFETIATVEATADDTVYLSSANFDEVVTYDLNNFPVHGRKHWSDYPAGVIAMLRDRGVRVCGVRLQLEGNVPLGAGLSSSASVEVATAVAILTEAAFDLPPAQIATLCQRAENEFVGGACGIMDQFVITNGRAGHALLLDCRSLEYELLRLPDTTQVVICNSMVQHEVAHGEYGDRRSEVEQGQAVLTKMFPHIKSLRDATLEDLEAARGAMSESSYRRCRHVITENGRVIRAKAALENGDMRSFGDLMYEAHASFRDDFAASCVEVDTLVELARGLPGCFGGRITGGGFGGCTVNLVEKEQAEGFRERLIAGYREQFGIEAECYLSSASDGAIARLSR